MSNAPADERQAEQPAETETRPAESALRPPLTLRVFSLLVILVSLGFMGMSVGMFFSWDVCMGAFGVLLLPICTAIGVQQYRGTFRSAAGAAMFVAVALLLLSFLFAFGTVTNFCEAVWQGGFVEALGLFAFLLLYTAFLFVASLLNYGWATSLKGRPTQPSKSFTLKELFGFVTAAAMVFGLAAFVAQDARTQYAEHLSPDETSLSVPPGASDICYCHGFRGTIAYEFTIDEQGFLDWVEERFDIPNPAESKHESFGPIDRETRIRRYVSLSADLHGPEYAVVSQGGYITGGSRTSTAPPSTTPRLSGRITPPVFIKWMYARLRMKFSPFHHPPAGEFFQWRRRWGATHSGRRKLWDVFELRSESAFQRRHSCSRRNRRAGSVERS